MNERKKHKKRKKTEEQRKEINKSPAPGLYFVMYRTSGVQRFPCMVFFNYIEGVLCYCLLLSFVIVMSKKDNLLFSKIKIRLIVLLFWLRIVYL